MSELHQLTAAQQLRALRSKEISSRELTGHYLDRIARLDAELGAFVTVVGEHALREANLADERLAAGDAGRLGGLPIGIKDLAATAGIRTTFGSAPLAEFVPTDDSWTVGLLRRAGAVVVGKTNTPEFGATCHTENDVTDRPAVTPYDPGRYSSGSSGGAATAVAAGLLPLAHGSDGAGSIRTPASTCHLVGVKPSRGLVSPAPASAFFSTSIEGPLARTVEDAALLLDVMAEPSPADLYGWRPDPSWAETLQRQQNGPLRVAVWTATGVNGVDPHPEAVLAVNRAAALLGDLGHEVHQIKLPVSIDGPVLQAITAWFASAVGLAVPQLIPADQRHRLQPFTRYLAAMGEKLSGSDILLAQAVLARYASTYLSALGEFDVALTPTTNGPPVPIGHFDTDGVEAVAGRMLAWSCYTPWVNLSGQPAVTVPSHLDSDGLPHGVQLVGRPRQDAELLAVAAQLESAGFWDDVHPPCWNQ